MIVRDRFSLPPHISNILVIQLGDIGDVVWATPCLWAIKTAFPEAKVSVVVREGSGELLEADPSLSRIFEVRKYRSNTCPLDGSAWLFPSLWRQAAGRLCAALAQLRFLRDLREERFDAVFDLRADDRGAFTAWLTGAPLRIAQYYRGLPFWRNMLFTHLVDLPPSRERVLGATDQSLRIMRPFGIEAALTTPRLWVSAEVERSAVRILEREGIGEGGKWVTINPFSRWSYKEWTHEKWVRIIEWLMEEWGMPAVIVGSPAERARAAGITAACRAAYNLAGRTTLAELAAVLSASRLHIGVDSAAPLIAAAVGTPTVTIYGPSDWRDWAPVGNHHRVVIPPLECVPCRNKGCDGSGESRCLRMLRAEEVERVIRQALAQPS